MFREKLQFLKTKEPVLRYRLFAGSEVRNVGLLATYNNINSLYELHITFR